MSVLNFDFQIEAIPKDDSTSERRRELQKEVEVAKRNLAQQVHILSHLSFHLRMANMKLGFNSAPWNLINNRVSKESMNLPNLDPLQPYIAVGRGECT